MRTMVISFLVSVPVLSEQMTEVDPSVSTDDSFFTIARWAAIRCTPSASTTDKIAGNPSGTAATAIDTPSSNTFTTSCPDCTLEVTSTAETTTAAIPTTASPSKRPSRAISCCSGVGSSTVRASSPAMCPISVRIPVAVTTARPTPWLTAVPL